MTRLLAIGAAVLAGLASTTPAADSPTSQPTKPTVLVLPFSSPKGPGATWVGRAAKDDMVSSLRRDLDATVKTSTSVREVPDTAAAINLAKQYHANYVIYGSAHEVDTIARVTGQVIDVETGQPLGGLKVTGPATSIIEIDDALTMQAVASLPQTMIKPEALAQMQQYMQPLGDDPDAPSADGLAMLSQSYPVGSTTFVPAMLQDDPIPMVQNTTYIYSPTIVVSAGYGFGGVYAPDYYGARYNYPSAGISTPYRHDHHTPVIHHGPQRPRGPRGGDAGIVIADRSVAGSDAGGANYNGGNVNGGPVVGGPTGNVQNGTSFGMSGTGGTPFMGGGQSFPAQNGFISSGAAGFSPFTGPRFNNTPNLARGGRTGGR